MRPTKSRKLSHSWVGVLIALLLAGVAVFIVLQRQYIVDRVLAAQYQPTAEIAELAKRTTMSSMGELYFYASHPSLEATQAFNKQCDRKEAGSAILGCYRGGKIYLYDIQNDELDGIREVTAAHEMLHAAYERLDGDERARLGQLLEAAYKRQPESPELVERMEFYARTQPGDRITELHSILGTEATDIGPELEAHYARYIDDRAAVVVLYHGYASRFQQLRDKQQTLSAELDAIAEEVTADTKAYNTLIAQLNTDIESFNERARQGQFSSSASFAAARQALVRRTDSADAMSVRINQAIERYEQLRQQYNAVAQDSNDLYKSIDSSLAPSPSL